MNGVPGNGANIKFHATVSDEMAFDIVHTTVVLVTCISLLGVSHCSAAVQPSASNLNVCP